MLDGFVVDLLKAELGVGIGIVVCPDAVVAATPCVAGVRPRVECRRAAEVCR